MRRIMLCSIVLFISCMQKNPAITGTSGEKIDSLQINQFVIQEQAIGTHYWVALARIMISIKSKNF